MLDFVVSGLRSGLRGKTLQAVFFLGIVMIGIAFLSGFFSPRQPQAVVLDIGFSGIRFSLILLNLLWVQELVAREIDRRTILFSLAYPVSRVAFLAGRFIAILVLSTIAAILLGFLLLMAVTTAGGGYEQGTVMALGVPFWIGVTGFVLDAAVVCAFSLCLAALSTTPMLPLAMGAAFAIAGKALGATMNYLGQGADGDEAMVSRYGPLIEGIRWVVPDLSRLDWREWSMYAVSPSAEILLWSATMAIAYMVLMLAIAAYFFARREFS